MLESDSVTKGFFFYQPIKISGKKKKKSRLQVPDPLSDFHESVWYKGYKEVWNGIEDKLKAIGDDAMNVLLNDMVSFIQGTPPLSVTNQIPTIVLLTGVNLPDHRSMFNYLKEELQEKVTKHVAMISSCDCTNIKQIVEKIVIQLIHNVENTSQRKVKNGQMSRKSDQTDTYKNVSGDEEVFGSDGDSSDMDVDCDDDLQPLKKNDCTMPYLAQWYSKKFEFTPTDEKPKLVIVLKDFEGFQLQILQYLILILSGYRELLPVVLVFGVATTEAAIGQSLTHQITSRLSLKVFQSQPSVYFLNNTIDKVFLTPDCPFQLSGKLLKFFTDVFLFYDFSVHQFTQGIKYCVMDHFFQNDLVSLFCQEERTVRNKLKSLKPEDLVDIKCFPSLKKYVEDRNKSTICQEESDLTKAEIMFIISLLRKAIAEFYICLRILHVLVHDLPQAPLGKQLREIYCTAMSKDISKTAEYKECQQFLNFSSKDQIEEKIAKIQTILSNSLDPNLNDAKCTINKFKLELEQVGLKRDNRSPKKSPTKIDLNVKNRSQLKQRLAEISVKAQIKEGFEALRENIVNYLMQSLLPRGLVPYMERVSLWELVLVGAEEAKGRVVPRIRAPIHTALNNPHHYLQCKCCETSDENSILATMPDVCITYKLHLEGGPLINVYDWLQSFSMIVDFNDKKKNMEDVDEKIQARFTQTLAELEFLGFIKSSRRKQDHVSRLTWGGTAS